MLSANKAGVRPIKAKDFINRDRVRIVVFLILYIFLGVQEKVITKVNTIQR